MARAHAHGTTTPSDDAAGDGDETESVPVDPARLPRVTRLARGPPMGRQPCAGECGRTAIYRVETWRIPRYVCRACLVAAVTGE